MNWSFIQQLKLYVLFSHFSALSPFSLMLVIVLCNVYAKYVYSL